MKKFIKINIAAMMLLVLLTNMGYAVSFSYCNMTNAKTCNCQMDAKTNSINKIPCCENKNIIINNNADFLKNHNNDLSLNTDNIPVYNILTPIEIFKNEFSIVYQIIKPPTDIPVSESKLLI